MDIFYYMTTTEAIALGAAISSIITIVSIIGRKSLGWSIKKELWSFFVTTAPIFLCIAFVHVAPHFNQPKEEGDAQFGPQQRLEPTLCQPLLSYPSLSQFELLP